MDSFSIEKYRNLIGSSPKKIQNFLNTSIEYDYEKASQIRAFYLEDDKMTPVPLDVLSLRTIPQVYEDRMAICHEAALMAALLIKDSFNPPGVLHLISENVCEGHCICAYQDPKTELFGGVGFSRHEDLRERPAIHSSLESLANSYLLHNLAEFSYKSLPDELKEELKAIQNNKDYYNELIVHLNV